MAPKKTTVAATASDAPVDVNDTAATPVKKAPVKRAAKKDPAAPSSADGVASDTEGPKKRNMTAVSSDFVASLQNQLSEDLSAKLKAKDVKEICELFVKTLVDKVKNGEAVSFTNNMTFKRQVRCARTYKNLKTGEAINKPPHYVICMQVKPALKKAFDDLVVEPTTTTKPEGDAATIAVDDAVSATA